jgi:hypothetical protein
VVAVIGILTLVGRRRQAKAREKARVNAQEQQARLGKRR